jgi:hypothetical protein
MSFPDSRIATNAGTDIEATITLLGSDGNPIDLGEDPVLVSLVDVSAGISNAEVNVILAAPLGRVRVSIPWVGTREVGVNYAFRVRYLFEGEGIVYTTPLYGVIYQ